MRTRNPSSKKKLWRILLIGLLIVLVVGAGGFVLWASNPAQPEPQALNSLQSAEDIPGAQRAVIEDCSHLPQEECPLEFVSAIDQFLNTRLEVNNVN